MARPAGHQLNVSAFEDFCELTGTTATAVAEKANLRPSTVFGWTGGHYRASERMARRFAAALGVRPRTLFPTLPVDEQVPA